MELVWEMMMLNLSDLKVNMHLSHACSPQKAIRTYWRSGGSWEAAPFRIRDDEEEVTPHLMSCFHLMGTSLDMWVYGRFLEANAVSGAKESF